ncbi:drs2 neo1 protein [Coemansia sp. RSA 2399]|nr:drs2 neo1 protein [Coemansia sp. RSA 2399]
MSCRWKKKRWENVQVGDLIKISKDDWIPADCIVIASTGFDGTCFVETASLDGETTLKQKQALEVTNSEIQTPEQLAAFNAFTFVEPASSELYNFEGHMEHKGERYPLTPNQLLLRGSVLRNTAYVFAQAIYCGEHTRLRLNATRNVRTKAPQIQRITNRIVILVFLLLLVLCFVFSALGIHWSKSKSKKHWYLEGKEMSSAALIFGYIVMMNALIPISLYVTLEAVKIFQCWFIQQDVSMYHPDTDTRAEARTTAINEDLGMVRYVFSDKTGTLTENIMKLRAVMVSGFSYLHIDLDRLQEKSAGSSGLGGNSDTDDPAAAAAAADEPADMAAPSSPNIQRTSSRLSILRSGPFSAGTGSGRQSPSLLKTQLFSKHRRQHSLPSPMRSPATPGQGPRALQHIAAANRANNSNGVGNGNSLRLTFAKHVRGMSASVLRSPTSSVVVTDDDDDEEEVEEERLSSLGEHDYVVESSSQLESAVEDPVEADPDLTGEGDDDPRAHTKASEDAPVSDLLALPSSRKIMDSYSPPSEVFRARAEWFLRCMALCHTVQPDRDPVTGRITGYQATSPDEKALVAAAAELGYVMNNRAGPLVQLRVVASERMRDFNHVVIQGLKPSDSTKSPVPAASTPGTAVSTANSENPSPTDTDATHVEEAAEADNSAPDDADAQSFDRGVPPPHPTDRLGNYEILDVLEFSSARKRMSVIMRSPDGRVVMMSKGADSAILPRLVKPERLESNPDDTSYLPQPKQPSGANNAGSVFGVLPKVPPRIRRKLSNPSAAYLHSRSSSVASSNVDPMAPFDPMPLPPRFNEGFMLYGGGGGGESSSPRTPSGLCTSFDVGDDEDENADADADEDDEYGENTFSKKSIYGTLPSTPPVNFGAEHHRKQHSGVSQLRLAHRRLMSDSQFSTISEVSSFGDTQGHVEVPSSFETPSREEEEWARARALEALHQFSTEGLRTLMYAHKEVDPAVYAAWHQRYVTASTALANRQQQVEALCEEIEGDFLLSGVSAIEDRLQGGVPETIFKLRRAGIRVWMLTGDKVETAINIAKSCRLIETDMVETTSLDIKTVEQNKDKMSLLVMQSKTDYDELDRIISDALEVARSMVATIDDRFEKRSKRQKLKRGMKKFGNMLDPRRFGRSGKKDSGGDLHQQERIGQSDTRMSTLRDDQHSGGAGGDEASKESTKMTECLEAPLVDVELQRPATAIEWANDVAEAPGGGYAADVMRRSGSQSSSVSSDVTRGVANKSLTRNSDETPLSTGPFGTLVDSSNSNSNNGSGVTGGGSTSLAVVVDGETLATLEHYEAEGLLDKFLSLGTLCDAVICSRVSPSQKALIVHNMRVRCEGGGGKAAKGAAERGAWNMARRCLTSMAELFKHDNDKFMVTLAIGDGGNDIAMIQEAHVGIGIAGQEGLQASRSADFSIGQFRFLQKLLLVHGRWSYVRVSMFIMGTFYKCMAFYVTQLIFQFYTGFSGTSLFESWTLSMYNTLFSILPVLVVGIFEQDLQPETLMTYPELYRDMGPKNHLFTVPIFMQRVVALGVVHSVIAAYFPFASNMVLGRHAASDDQYIWSLTIYSIIVLIVTLKIAYVDVRRWVYLSHASVVLTLTLWFGWNGVLCHIYPSTPGDAYNVLGTFTMLMRKGPFWLQWIIFVAVALCLNVLALLVYTMRDPVEHRIATWVAYERRKEHVRHKFQRQAWLQRRGMVSSWELLNFKWLWRD